MERDASCSNRLSLYTRGLWAWLSARPVLAALLPLSPLPETCPLLSLVDSYLIMHVLSHCPDSECFQLRVVRTYTDNGVTQIWSMDPTPVMAAQLGQRCHNPDLTAREWVGALSSFSLSCLFIAFQTRLTQHRYSATGWALEVC